MAEKRRLIPFSPEECCGCEACSQKCPHKAIDMKYGIDGALYPVINVEKCTNCYLCTSVCQYLHIPELNTTKYTYAASLINEDFLIRSSSGGAFYALALYIVNKGGTVYGSAMCEDESTIYAKHIRVDNEDELCKLQGSKYVQSIIGDVYKDVYKDLQSNRLVLFSGTPCQVAGLKLYLGHDYNTLLTVDIVCHGVPGTLVFQKYMKN